MIGAANPNWKGGLLTKHCATCSAQFQVKPGRAGARFCSMRCVGVSQRGKSQPRASVTKVCATCSGAFQIARSHANRSECCSAKCSAVLRSHRSSGPGNPNWCGGLSRKPYPWNFRFISRAVILRDGGLCQNPNCAGTDARLTAHHIDYDKSNCADSNLITLCSACNSKANFGRERWQRFYAAIVTARAKKHGGGWQREHFS